MANSARNYVSRSFAVQYNLILLGGAALFSLASASPLPIAGALGLEALWLGLGSNLKGVRRWLDARDAVAIETENDAGVMHALETLDSEYSSRVLALEHALGELRHADVAPDLPDASATLAQIGKLGPAFLRLCESHQRIATFVRTTPGPELDEEVQRLKQSFTAEKDLGLRLAIRQGIQLAQRRVEQREKMVATLRSLSVRIDAVERSVGSLRSQSRALGLSALVASEIDALLTELGSEAAPAPESDDFSDFVPAPQVADAGSGA